MILMALAGLAGVGYGLYIWQQPLAYILVGGSVFLIATIAWASKGSSNDTEEKADDDNDNGNRL